MQDTFAGMIARSYGDPDDEGFVEKDLYAPSIEHINEAWCIAQDNGHDDLARLMIEEWSRRHIGNYFGTTAGLCYGSSRGLWRLQ
ncbi:MAG: hypothetical protein QM750_11830 [Rubrivivax sp.]